ncbi:hypothetical protein [Ferruginibacter albus]|uniref:hypothetical protein n=1 Tax=Ferruginibacter albus TaxID=2875540 RepID=UPI001CC7CFB4|nr:hypothetical protein [Ferruginibacter albus]UAY52149.1 hypothetical protein K9M53_00300 [Ferruginibacter albus]
MDSSVENLKNYMPPIYHRGNNADTVNSILKYFVVETKKELDTLLAGQNLDKIKIVQYDTIEAKQKQVFGGKSNKNIYGVLLGETVLTYLLFKRNKVWSFFFISKGSGDYSYFISL